MKTFPLVMFAMGLAFLSRIWLRRRGPSMFRILLGSPNAHCRHGAGLDSNAWRLFVRMTGKTPITMNKH
ncbi:MAG: hypothetical protein CM15mP128_3070 [Methanobacteriota archaeon]|nr:MAG: hypothetical protein CM15mP128_3070 [Euryarchaeota archaeon]